MKRSTLQRDAIRHVLTMAGRPLSIGEIFDMAKEEISGLGIATVYRTLKALQEEKLIEEVGLPGQTSRWELSGKAHHHHFLCDSCSKVFEIDGCPNDLGCLLPKGYTLENHDLLLSGQCEDCSKKVHFKRRSKRT